MRAVDLSLRGLLETMNADLPRAQREDARRLARNGIDGRSHHGQSMGRTRPTGVVRDDESDGLPAHMIVAGSDRARARNFYRE